MKTIEFITLLKENPNRHLEFKIDNGCTISPTFHITEIKNLNIESVDCGGNPDSYNQTVIQLMVNPLEKHRAPWTGKKVFSIFERVDQVKPLEGQAEIFFEYGDKEIRTSNFSIEEVQLLDDTLQIKFYAKPTVCKPSINAPSIFACC